jgi:hypothetical protein
MTATDDVQAALCNSKAGPTAPLTAHSAQRGAAVMPEDFSAAVATGSR